MVEPSDLIARLQAKADAEADPQVLLLHAVREMSAQLAEIQKAAPKNGGRNGRGLTDSAWRIAVALCVGAVMGLFTLLWNLNATIAVQTEQIERGRMDAVEGREETRRLIRENRDEFIKANTARIEGLDTRVRDVERRVPR